MLRTRRVGRRVLKVTVTSTVTVLVLGLSACGSTGPRISGSKAPAVIHISSSQSAGGKGLPTAGALDGAMRPYGDITYVFDGAYPALGATAGSWSFAAGATPDLARVAAMAKALGITGEVRTLPAEQGGGWAVGPNDGSAPTFMVSADSMLTWWYSSAAATVGGGCAIASGSSSGSSGAADTPSTAVVSPPDQPAQPPTTVVVPEPCTPPPAPHGVPDKATAEAKAKELFARMGLDVSKYLFTAYADQYSASASGQLLLDGAPSQITVSIGFGAEGAITYASGQMTEPRAGDEYPLVSPDVALARLNDKSGKWQFFGSPGVRMMGGVASDTITTVATSVATSGANAPSVAPGAPATIVDPSAPIPMPSCVAGTTVPAGDKGAIPEPMPCGTIAPPAPVTVHLSAVKLSSTMVWAQDGTVWLLPAYTFTSTDGGEYTVVAVDEQYLDMPVTPVTPVDTTVPEPVTTLPPSTTEPELTAPPTTEVPAVDLATASKALVGLSIDEAVKVALGNGWTVRVVEIDGVGQAVTADFQQNRVDVATKAGVVTAVTFIG